jgi:uncharacterized protein YgiM (DUF1202 family)
MIRKLILSFLICSPLFAEDFVSVKIKETKLRTKPQHWSSSVANLKYGDRLLKLKEEQGWTQASFTGKKIGYIQNSAVSDKKILLSTAETALLESSPGEAILAGKGFSKSTEADFSQKNPSANFSEINRLEKIKLSDQEMLTFVKSGKLAGASN